jgi:hypothetical protein
LSSKKWVAGIPKKHAERSGVSADLMISTG